MDTIKSFVKGEQKKTELEKPDVTPEEIEEEIPLVTDTKIDEDNDDGITQSIDLRDKCVSREDYERIVTQKNTALFVPRGDTDAEKRMWSYNRRFKVKVRNLKVENMTDEDHKIFLDFTLGGTQQEYRVQNLDGDGLEHVVVEGEAGLSMCTPSISVPPDGESVEIAEPFSETEWIGSYMDLEAQRLRIDAWSISRFSVNKLLCQHEDLLLSYASGRISRTLVLESASELKRKQGTTLNSLRKVKPIFKIHLLLIFQEIYDFELHLVDWKANGLLTPHDCYTLLTNNNSNANQNILNQTKRLQNSSDLSDLSDVEAAEAGVKYSNTSKDDLSVQPITGANSASELGNPKHTVPRLLVDLNTKGKHFWNRLHDSQQDSKTLDGGDDTNEYTKLKDGYASHNTKIGSNFNADPHSSMLPHHQMGDVGRDIDAIVAIHLDSGNVLNEEHYQNDKAFYSMSQVRVGTNRPFWDSLSAISFRGAFCDLESSKLEIFFGNVKAGSQPEFESKGVFPTESKITGGTSLGTVNFNLINIQQTGNISAVVSPPAWLIETARKRGVTLPQGCCGSLEGKIVLSNRPKYMQLGDVIEMDPDRAYVIVKVVKACNIHSKDGNPDVDSFAEAQLGGQVRRTRILRDTEGTPMFHQELIFDLGSLKGDMQQQGSSNQNPSSGGGGNTDNNASKFNFFSRRGGSGRDQGGLHHPSSLSTRSFAARQILSDSVRTMGDFGLDVWVQSGDFSTQTNEHSGWSSISFLDIFYDENNALRPFEKKKAYERYSKRERTYETAVFRSELPLLPVASPALVRSAQRASLIQSQLQSSSAPRNGGGLVGNSSTTLALIEASNSENMASEMAEELRPTVQVEIWTYPNLAEIAQLVKSATTSSSHINNNATNKNNSSAAISSLLSKNKSSLVTVSAMNKRIADIQRQIFSNNNISTNGMPLSMQKRFHNDLAAQWRSVTSGLTSSLRRFPFMARNQRGDLIFLSQYLQAWKGVGNLASPLAVRTFVRGLPFKVDRTKDGDDNFDGFSDERRSVKFALGNGNKNGDIVGGGGIWHTPDFALTSKSGGNIEHCLLECSLLRGLGYVAFVCIGRLLDDRPHSWIMKIDMNGTVGFVDPARNEDEIILRRRVLNIADVITNALGQDIAKRLLTDSHFFSRKAETPINSHASSTFVSDGMDLGCGTSLQEKFIREQQVILKRAVVDEEERRSRDLMVCRHQKKQPESLSTQINAPYPRISPNVQLPISFGEFDALCPYGSIEIVFNEFNIWANLQHPDPTRILYDLHDVTRWRSFIPVDISAQSSSSSYTLQPCFGLSNIETAMAPYKVQKRQRAINDAIQKVLRKNRSLMRAPITRFNNDPSMIAFLLKGLKLVIDWQSCSSEDVIFNKAKLLDWRRTLLLSTPPGYVCTGGPISSAHDSPSQVADVVWHRMKHITQSKDTSLQFACANVVHAMPAGINLTFVYFIGIRRMTADETNSVSLDIMYQQNDLQPTFEEQADEENTNIVENSAEASGKKSKKSKKKDKTKEENVEGDEYAADDFLVEEETFEANVIQDELEEQADEENTNIVENSAEASGKKSKKSKKKDKTKEENVEGDEYAADDFLVEEETFEANVIQDELEEQADEENTNIVENSAEASGKKSKKSKKKDKTKEENVEGDEYAADDFLVEEETFEANVIQDELEEQADEENTNIVENSAEASGKKSKKSKKKNKNK